MDRIERWIKRTLASAVDQGIGQWAEDAQSPFGRPIYQTADGPVTIVLSEFGFSYSGPTSAISCGYDEVANLELETLPELVKARG